MSFTIGSITIENELALGPMAGITDLPFRLLCKEQGAGLLYTEMVSAKGVMYHNRNTAELLRTTEAEHPIALQLFGSDPEIMASQAEVLSELPFDFFDINMGCPVPKVVNNGEGSALMQTPDKVFAIVDAMVKRQPKPVLVKIRKGFLTENAADVAKAAEDAGAQAVCVHGRLRSEYYMGHSDWDCVRKVKGAVSVPVIGSGDVTCGADAIRMKEETNCDAVMIARAARGNPWIFTECNEALRCFWDGMSSKAYEVWKKEERDLRSEEGICPKMLGEQGRPEISAVIDMILRHARLQLDSRMDALQTDSARAHMLRVLGLKEEEPVSRTHAEDLAMREMRKHVAWYLAGYPHSAELRRRSNELNTYDELVEMLSIYKK